MKILVSPRFLYRSFTLLLLVAMLLSVYPATPAYAATLTVVSTADAVGDNGECTLREAIINANDDAATNADCAAGTGNDTIVFNIAVVSPTITLGSSLPTITDVDGLIIDGTNLNASGGTVTISGNDAVRIIQVQALADATFQDLTMTAGQMDGDGAAIRSYGNLTISNTTFTNNRTITNNQRDGGAIFHTGGTLSITGSTFTGNYTQDNGGAIYIDNGSGTMSILDSTFQNQNNAAIDDGAAVYLLAGTLEINGSSFDNNTSSGTIISPGNGGAVFQAVGSTLYIGNTSGNTFSNNSALGDGGAIRQGWNLVIGDNVNTFSGNTAGGDGGAIVSLAGNLTVNNAVFTNNTSGASTPGDGGAIGHNAASSLTVTNSTFTGNTASNDGGAINMDNTASSLTISGSTFTNNSADDDAGAIYNDGAPIVITTSTFQGNTAGNGSSEAGHGGAIYNSTTSLNAGSIIKLSTFVNNSITMNGDYITYGGAISNQGMLIIANSTFSGNSLTKTTTGSGSAYGGAIYAGGTTTVHNSTFSGNSVSENGTGVGSGGTVYSAAGSMTIANSILAGGLENGAPGNCGATVTDGGNNIDFNGGDCGAGYATADPNLGGLTGSPAYFPLNAGSSAIDTGNNAICATVSTTNNESQNGLTRPQDGDSNGSVICDIGSYEYGIPDPPATVVSITRVNPSPTAAVSVDFLITFSEDVTGGDIANFTLTTTGAISGASITSVTGSGSTRTVTVNTGTGNGTIRLDMVNSTGITDGGGNPIDNLPFTTGEEYVLDRTLTDDTDTSVSNRLPKTGFPQGVTTTLPLQPASEAYTAVSSLWLEIPKLDVEMSIVGVPQTSEGWNVTWLNRDAGWLSGSAFPTWTGNSVITGHVWDALNRPGPFAQLKTLNYGDVVRIHAFGQVYAYEVRESQKVLPTSTSTVFKHKEQSWITLITCEGYKENSETYSYRRLVRAVLISVSSE